MNVKDWVTLVTAIWGAITGTVAIILRIRDASRDKPILLVQPQFEYSGGFDLPHKIALQVDVTNIGRRPTTLDAVFALYRPSKVWQIPIWWFRRRGKIWLASSRSSQQLPEAIGEGKHTTFYFNENRIWPTPEFDPMNLGRIIVQDKAGRKWKSTIRFGQRRLRSERFAKNLATEDLESKSLQREFSIRLHHINKSYRLRLRYLLDNSYKHHYEDSRFLSKAQETYNELLAKGKQFIAGEINNPME